jgi:predicted nucleotidyltransferase
MTRQEINRAIVNYLRPYNPQKIGIFGSVARNEETSESDIDILIKFGDVPSLFEFIRMENDLTEILGRKVDLVSEGALKNQRLKAYIFRDLQVIFG